jgi:branched-chain amino acid transport system permease protein
MNSIQFAQTLVNGLMLGGTFALIGLGFSIVWGIMNLINIAHGEFIMLGAYTTFFLYTLFGIDPFLTLPISMLALFVLGYILERGIVNWVIRAPLLVKFLLTFGISLTLQNIALQLFTGDYRSVTTSYSGAGLEVGGIKIAYVRLAALALSIVLVGLFHLFLTRTRIGNSIRAAGMDLDAARLTGVKIAPTFGLTYGLSAALAGAAGSLISMTFPITPTMGGGYTVYAFLICILGGLGSVPGALLGGLVLALLQVFGGFFAPEFKDAIAFSLLVVILLVRPEGIIGKAFYSGSEAA